LPCFTFPVMRLIFIFLISYFFCQEIYGQHAFFCKYTDTLKASFSEKQIDSLRKDFADKGLPKSVIDGFLSGLFKDPDRFVSIQERNVLIRDDSAFITLNYIPQPGQLFSMETNKELIVNGKIYRYSEGLDKYISASLSDSSAIFSPTRQSLKILGYSCDGYESADGVYKIWVTQQLPSSINPGIPVNNVEGGILGFEVKGINAFTRSIAQAVEKKQ
jgi:hypothetical protein